MYFPRSAYKRWMMSTVDSRAHRSIGRVLGPIRPSEPEPTTAGELLAELAQATAHGLFQVELAANEAHVRGRLTSSEFEARKRQLAAFFLSAAPFGIEGDICMLAEGIFLGFGISLALGKGSVLKLTEEQIQNASLDPDLDVISGYFHILAPEPPRAPTLPPQSLPPPSSKDQPIAMEAVPESSNLRPAFVPGPRTGLLDVRRK
jgi:hypothetical protein